MASSSAQFLLTHFDRLAEAPGGIAKLRALLIQLAVTGTLEGETSASQNWTECVIEDCFAPLADGRTLHQGWSPQCEGHPSENEKVWGMLKTTSIQPGEFQPQHNKRLPDSLEPRPHLEVQTGDLLITCAGPRVRCGVACLVRTTRKRLMISGKMYRFRVPPERIEPRFMELFLQSEEVNAAVNAMKTGSSESGLNLTHQRFRQLPVRYPPLAEQRRIVAKVEELMSLCDALEAAQREREEVRAHLRSSALHQLASPDSDFKSAAFVLQNLPRLTAEPEDLADIRQSVRQLAVEGRLVPQTAEDESVQSLIAQISATRNKLIAAGKLAKHTPQNSVSDKEQGFALPTGWAWERFGNLTFCRDGERIPIASDERKTRARTYDYYGASGVIDKIDGYLFDKPLLLIGEDGANLINRSTPIAYIARGKYWVNNHAHVLDGISEDFLRFLELSINAINLEAYVTGTAQPKMNQAKMNSIPIPLPPLAEQRRIVAKVDELMAVLDALEAALTTARTTSEHLLAATIARLHEAAPAEASVLLAAEAPAPYGEPAEIIPLESSPEFIRATLAAEIVERMHGDHTFGRIKFQKVIYLAEYLAQLTEIDSRVARFQNGPHDPALIDQVEAKMKACEWFDAIPRPDGHGSLYRPLAKAGSHRTHFEQRWPKQAPLIRRLIDEMKSWKTERCERFATAYAAWNDLLIWDEPVDEAAILREILERWHPAKLNIPKSKWLETLQWMKTEDYEPIGFGRATTSKREAELFTSCDAAAKSHS